MYIHGRLFRLQVMKAKHTVLLTWLYLVFCLSFLTLPLRCLRRRKVSEESASHLNMNNSDSDFTIGFSDGEFIMFLLLGTVVNLVSFTIVQHKVDHRFVH